MKNGCPVCRNLNELSATQCRFCGAALTPPTPPDPRAVRTRPRWPIALGVIAVLILLPIIVLVGFSGNDADAASAGFDLQIGTDEGVALQFNPNTVEVPANTAINLTFRNQATVEHNLAFETGITAKTTERMPAGAVETLNFTSPESGEYVYVCTIHPGMAGKLTVTAAAAE